MTTAQFRKMAQDAERELQWTSAAYLWDKAIQSYPSGSGELARLDIEKMTKRMKAARVQAGMAV